MSEAQRSRLRELLQANRRRLERPAALVRLALEGMPAMSVGLRVQADLVARMRKLRVGPYFTVQAADLTDRVTALSSDKRVFLMGWDVEDKPAFIISRTALATKAGRNPTFLSPDGFIALNLQVTRGLIVDADEEGPLYCRALLPLSE